MEGSGNSIRICKMDDTDIDIYAFAAALSVGGTYVNVDQGVVTLDSSWTFDELRSAIRKAITASEQPRT